MRYHYLRDGTAKFAFTITRAEFFILVGILLKCFLEASDRELFSSLLATVSQEQGKLQPTHPQLTCCILLHHVELPDRAGLHVIESAAGQQVLCGLGLHLAGHACVPA